MPSSAWRKPGWGREGIRKRFDLTHLHGRIEIHLCRDIFLDVYMIV